MSVTKNRWLLRKGSKMKGRQLQLNTVQKNQDS